MDEPHSTPPPKRDLDRPASTEPALGANGIPSPPLQPEPERALTRDEVEAQLKGTEASIDQHVEALEDEVSTLGTYVKERLLSHPLIGLGGALLGGLVIGWIFGGGRKGPSGAKAAEAALRVLVNRYMQAVVQEAQAAIQSGTPPEEAVRAALLERMPVVPAPVQEPEPGGFKKFFSLLGATLLRVSVMEGFKYLTSSVVPPMDDAPDGGGEAPLGAPGTP